MTAIAGYWSFDEAPVDQFVGRMLSAQSIYGNQQSLVSARGLGLGRRLSPFLPEDKFDISVQSEGGRLLVADVRLDNRSELIDALGLDGASSVCRPDSKLLLDCLLKWGEGALPRLNGEFAFALWDPEQQILLAARDIMGKRPLHFHRGKNFFAFASMASGLHSIPDLPYNFDPEHVADQLSLMPWRDDRCWYEGIRRVLPAHVLKVTRQREEQRQYWDFPMPDGEFRSDYAEGLRHTFDEAVRAQTRGAETAIATHLSSGLDSSCVTSTAARQFSGKVYAFTGAPRREFDGPVPRRSIADETNAAARIAANYPNIEHVVVPGEGSPLDHLDAMFRYFQGPELSLCNAVWGQAINKAAKDRGLKVLLTGDDGNMTISYSGMECLPYLLRRGKVGELARLWALLLRRRVPLLTIGAQTLSPFLPKPIWRAAIAVRRRPVTLSKFSAVSASRTLDLERKARELSLDFSDRNRSDPNETRRWVFSRGDLGNYVKGVLGQWGISLRDPTSDKRVIEYCFSVPPTEYIKDGLPRALARSAFSDRLPPETINSLVRGYQGADWYERLAPDLGRAREEVAFIERCTSASDVISTDWLSETLDTWPKQNWARADISTRYRAGLLRGIAAGHFMRKVAGTN